MNVAMGDIWNMLPQAKPKYDDKFYQLQPINGYITGEQAKSLFLMSGLPPQTLAQIWSLADRDGDGKMDINEFAIAMFLIELRMKGIELPKSLPPHLRAGGSTLMSASLSENKPRTSSVSSQDSPTSSGMPGPLIEWAVPQASKLKFTQLFNSHDRTRTGFLTGAQARNILVSTGLNQKILASIWSMSDIDGDGRLSSEEFVLAMHLAECASRGEPLPASLPPDLVPPSHRRKRSASIQSTGSSASHGLSEINLIGDFKEDSKLMQQTSFEDKRRENFEKGQAELEKRRAALQEAQRKDQEERDRKDREEYERRERIRQEQERRRQQELERQLARQRELEQEKEEQRKRALEQREAARREMERQRQLEWERQREQELVAQRQKEQEAVRHLRNLNKSLACELEQLSNKACDLNEKISETKQSVAVVKSCIDNMRIERDTKLSEMNSVKGKIKEMNDRLLILSQEKISLKAQLTAVPHANPLGNAHNQVTTNFAGKEAVLLHLKNSLKEMENENQQKTKDIDSNNNQIEELKTKLQDVVERYKSLHAQYVERREIFLAERASRANGGNAVDNAWGTSATADWNDDKSSEAKKYRVLYAFEARNEDELSVMPGDVVLVNEDEAHEPGWLGGELQGKRGWFPEAYAEPLDESTETVHIVGTEMKRTLEGISEAPEHDTGAVKDVLQHSENSSFTQPIKSQPSLDSQPQLEELRAMALFPWKAKKENHLTFIKGDVIIVKEQQDAWWHGQCGDKVGWFPKSYVKLISDGVKTSDSFQEAFNASENAEPPEVTTSPPEYYVAAYAYQSQEPSDLCFEGGESILVTRKDGDWWTGILGNRSGIFPANYVKRLDESNDGVAASQAEAMDSTADSEGKTDVFQSIDGGKWKKGEVYSVLSQYKSNGVGQLDLEKGQLVHVRKKTPGGWWEGEVQVKGKKRQIGWFPASYVKELTGSRASSARSTPEPQLFSRFTEFDSGPQQNDQAVALYPFQGEREDELTFQKGDIITLLECSDSSWWKGELHGASGIFPSNYVEIVNKKNCSLSTIEKKRQQHIQELISTEESYVEDMSIVLDVFQRPLKEVLTKEELRSIFVNWKELIVCNTKLLRGLRVRSRMSTNNIIHKVGDLLCENLPRFTPYIRFCSCQLNAATLIQNKTENCQQFKEVSKRCMSESRTKGMPLSSFLLKPMQRITKYPLLIEKILGCTEDDHPDRGDLDEAVVLATRLCEQVNEGVRERENSDRLEWIQNHVLCEQQITFNSLTNSLGPRKILHVGILHKAKSNKELMAFLFNDFLLLTQPLKEIGRVSNVFTSEKAMTCLYREYKRPLFLNIMSMSMGDSENNQDDCTFSICCSNSDKIHLKTFSATDRILWMKKMDSAAKNYSELEKKNLNHLRRLPSQSVRGVGRLLVVVVEGTNLKACSNGQSSPYCEVSMGAQEQRTRVEPRTLNPRWDASMQFLVTDPLQDVLCISVFDRDLFSPNEFLGRTEIRVADIYTERSAAQREPVVRTLPLYEVETGRLIIKFDLQMFDGS